MNVLGLQCQLLPVILAVLNWIHLIHSIHTDFLNRINQVIWKIKVENGDWEHLDYPAPSVKINVKMDFNDEME